MTNLDITYADLETTAKALDTAREAMAQTAADLVKQVDNLITAGFRTDKASVEFGATYTQLNDGLSQAIGALEGMAEFLRAVSSTYADVDGQLAAGIG